MLSKNHCFLRCVQRRRCASGVIHLSRWAALLYLAVSLLPRGARADSDQVWLEPGHRALAMDVSFTHREEDHSTVTPFSVLFFNQYVVNAFAVSLDWGVCSLLSEPDQGEGDAKVRVGNLFLAARYIGRVASLRWRVGLGLAVPLAAVDIGPDGRLQRAAYNYAVAMRGLWNAWLWAPDRISFVAPMEATWQLRGGWLFEGQGAVAGVVPIRHGESDADLFIQLAGAAGYQLAPVTLGVRLQTVIVPTVSADQAQVSLAPWIRGHWAPLFTSLSLPINLDGPLGGLRGMDRWALILAIGAEL